MIGNWCSVRCTLKAILALFPRSESHQNSVLCISDEPPLIREGTTVYMSIEARNRWVATTQVAQANCFVCEIAVDAVHVPTTTRKRKYECPRKLANPSEPNLTQHRCSFSVEQRMKISIFLVRTVTNKYDYFFSGIRLAYCRQFRKK